VGSHWEPPNRRGMRQEAHVVFFTSADLAKTLGPPGQRSTAQFLCLPKGVHPEAESEWSGAKAN
jgi:hypothetical protein